MKKLTYILFTLCCMTCFTACDDDEYEVVQVAAPAVVSFTPAEGTTVRSGNVTVEVTYDKNIFFASGDAPKIQVSEGGSVVSASVVGVSSTLTLTANLPGRGTSYTLTIPDGLVTGPNGVPAPSVSLSLNTRGLDATPVMDLTPEALKVYDYLQECFEVRSLSATMAKDGVDGLTGSWNTAGADDVSGWTGVYPAMNCFDYLHLAASAPGAWIDYSDITPVQDWWNDGGLVLAMWHWNVPKTNGSTDSNDYTSTLSETAFNIDNAFTEGSWEYNTVQADLAKMAGYLKLLKDAGIPVIWRPLHEAAQGYFWWGKNAENYKRLWQTMFDYFTAQGLNNLIWVWTSETSDLDWYPGDEYVDIVSRDLYGNTAANCVEQYSSLSADYGTKPIALSECGSSTSDGTPLGLLSEQWSGGAKWLWFMPWYDSATVTHADQAWWQDAMSQDYVVSRDELPDFKN